MSISSLSEGSGLHGRSGAPAVRAERLPLPGHVASPDLSQPWNGSGPLSGEQDSGPQGSGCLDVVKDNYKDPCLDTARGGTPVLGYRHTLGLNPNVTMLSA